MLSSILVRGAGRYRPIFLVTFLQIQLVFFVCDIPIPAEPNEFIIALIQVPGYPGPTEWASLRLKKRNY